MLETPARPVFTMRASGSRFRRGLEAFVSCLPSGLVMAEIGSYAGESASIFLTKASRMVCIDPWEPYEEDNGPVGVFPAFDTSGAEAAFDAVLEASGGRITKIKAASLDAVQQFPDASFDLVYLDGNHAYPHVIADILAWMPKVKQGGLLAGHDYAEMRPGVIQGVTELFGYPDALFCDTTWVKRLP